MNGIPTLYNGVTFKSRAEAKYAFLFDRLGWAWQYEPLDLTWYVPDFLLMATDTLFEVKGGILKTDDLHPFIEKIKQSGWTGRWAIAGAIYTCCIGIVFPPETAEIWREAENQFQYLGPKSYSRMTPTIQTVAPINPPARTEKTHLTPSQQQVQLIVGSRASKKDSITPTPQQFTPPHQS